MKFEVHYRQNSTRLLLLANSKLANIVGITAILAFWYEMTKCRPLTLKEYGQSKNIKIVLVLILVVFPQTV